MELTLIVPVYQEEGVIADTLMELDALLRRCAIEYEILVADDGSTDGTGDVVLDLQESMSHLRYVWQQSNRGRGAVLTMAIPHSRGDIICHVDADLQIAPEVIPRMISEIRRGADIVIGSKHHPESQLEYSIWRRLQSTVYNTTARNLLGIEVHDFQCGAKAYRRSSIDVLIGQLERRGWAWDTEMILKASLLGLRLVEVPVQVKHAPARRSRVRIWDAAVMGWQLIRLCLWTTTAGRRSGKHSVREAL